MRNSRVIDTESYTPAENLRAFLTSICIGFTIVMIIGMGLGSVFGDESSRQGLIYGWSTLGACILASALQFVFFTPVVIKRLSYPLRLILFGVCLYAVLCGVNIVCRWVPVRQSMAWVSFTIMYLIILAVLAAIFSRKQGKESRELNEKLSEYRMKNSEE